MPRKKKIEQDLPKEEEQDVWVKLTPEQVFQDWFDSLNRRTKRWMIKSARQRSKRKHPRIWLRSRNLPVKRWKDILTSNILWLNEEGEGSWS